jgi:hypothetical protein
MHPLIAYGSVRREREVERTGGKQRALTQEEGGGAEGREGGGEKTRVGRDGKRKEKREKGEQTIRSDRRQQRRPIITAARILKVIVVGTCRFCPANPPSALIHVRTSKHTYTHPHK